MSAGAGATPGTGDGWDRLAVLLEGALARPASERDGYLRDHCADPRDRVEIAALLAASAQEDGPVDRVMAALGPSPTGWPTDATRTRVGPYELLRELGRGGMGVVYLARRADGLYQRLVALKLARTPVLEPSLQARFIAERDILAGLAHPSIAPLFDGGVTDDGLPYFTMEYVDGQAIDAYCDAHALDLRARIRLFLAICGAVAAAHRALVVHLDLKPTNVLVTAEGSVKLLDFGIARLLAADGSAPQGTTPADARLMTPAYASPEQVSGGPVSTATDVYALGLVLYELLCGRRAHRLPVDDVTQLGLAAPPADRVPMADALFHPDPAHPAATPDTVARARGTTAARLARQLGGDLADIAAKALRRDPDQRYATAAQMAEDLARYLDGRPVIARGPSALYRAKRFVGRHRLWLLPLAIALTALIGSSVMAVLHARDMKLAAERERLDAARAREVSDFLVGLFEASDPDVLQNHRTSPEQMLDQGVRRANTLSAQPLLQARLLNAIGSAYFNLGRFDEAAALATRALALSRSAVGNQHPDVARSYRLFGLATGGLGKQEEAVRAFRAALDIDRALGGERGVEAATDLHHLGYGLVQAGHLDEGERRIVESLAMRRTLLAPGHEDIATSLAGLAFVRGRQGRPREAVDLYREALTMRLARLGEAHPEVARARQNLAAALSTAGAFDEAAGELHRALEVYRAAYGERHPSIATTLNNLGVLENKRGRLAESISYFRAALDMRCDLLGPRHPSTLLAQANLATLLARAGRLAEGEAMLREVLARAASSDAGARVISRPQLLANLADLLRQRGRLAQAEAMARQALSLGSERQASPLTEASILATLGRTLMDRHRDAEAGEILQRALAIRQERLGAEHPDAVRVRRLLEEVRARHPAQARARP